MKVTKTAVYRITTSMACGCSAQQEFEDADYKKPIGKAPVYEACKKHKGQPGVDVLDMVLTERVEEEAANHVSAPVAPVNPSGRENPSAVVDDDGNLVMRVPVQKKPGGAIVRASGATATSGPPNAPVAPAVVAGRPVAPLPQPGAQPIAAAPRPPAPRPAAPVNRAQAARTGPVRTYQRPTSSAETAATRPAPTAVGTEEEPDLFEQNDPDYNNAR